MRWRRTESIFHADDNGEASFSRTNNLFFSFGWRSGAWGESSNAIIYFNLYNFFRSRAKDALKLVSHSPLSILFIFFFFGANVCSEFLRKVRHDSEMMSDWMKFTSAENFIENVMENFSRKASEGLSAVLSIAFEDHLWGSALGKLTRNLDLRRQDWQLLETWFLLVVWEEKLIE